MYQDIDFNDQNNNNVPKTSTEHSNTKSSDSQRKLSQMKYNNKENPVIIDNKYVLLNVIYQGKTSTIFEAINLQLQQACVVRMTLISKSDNSTKILQYFKTQFENQFEEKYQSGKIVQNPQDCLVRLIDHGVFMNQYNYQVLNKTGPSLKFWFNFWKSRFSFECIILIILKTIDALQLLHSGNFIHANLNMQSLLTSLENQKTLSLGNLQQAILFKPNSKIGQKCQHLNKYSSLGQHLGIQIYPKDDLESLLYIVIQLLTDGEFFDQQKNFKTRSDKLQWYFSVKHSFLPEKVLKNYPPCFTDFANKIKFLNPMELPINYDILKSVFKGCKNLEFDWNPLINGLKKNSGNTSQQVSMQNVDLKSGQLSLDTINESLNEQVIDIHHSLVKTQKHIGDYCDFNPETQESDGEISFEEESTDKSYVYCFK
ncbi:unnamed protein product [Paramecium primaurelia]|uniref:Protein kinase domain-containing protein n=1 Tax=Paramecium primaurelia TaxID=5886 RepID=A0A8S1LFW9_PARPR|nr:unnamed protein product [Paramecium primaurelia]